MKGYQLYCKGIYVLTQKERVLVDNKVYLKAEALTEEKIEGFKNYCANGGGDYDLDRDTIIIKITVVDIIE